MRQRSFGSEISGNRGLSDELLIKTRAAIISKWEEGALKKELAAEFRVHRNTIAKTITRWQKHHQLELLPRSGRLEVLSRREKRLLF
jgi:transposase